MTILSAEDYENAKNFLNSIKTKMVYNEKRLREAVPNLPKEWNLSESVWVKNITENKSNDLIVDIEYKTNYRVKLKKGQTIGDRFECMPHLSKEIIKELSEAYKLTNDYKSERAKNVASPPKTESPKSITTTPSNFFPSNTEADSKTQTPELSEEERELDELKKTSYRKKGKNSG